MVHEAERQDEAGDHSDAQQTTTRPLLYLLLENPSKSNNVGPILRCAAAYAVDRVVFVGYDRCAVAGSHGASKHVDVVAFPTFPQAAAYLRDEAGVRLVVGILGAVSTTTTSNDDDDAFYHGDGVPVRTVAVDGRDVLTWATTDTDDGSSDNGSLPSKRSYPIHVRPFQGGDDDGGGGVCFLLSKHNRGLPAEQAHVCDRFVHLPTVPPIVTSDDDDDGHGCRPYRFVDVQSCLSIVLHHYAAFRRYDERTFDGYKFRVEDRRHGSTASQAHKTHQRKLEKLEAERACEDTLDGGLWGDTFFG